MRVFYFPRISVNFVRWTYVVLARVQSVVPASNFYAYLRLI
jgi:hypothetical protein